MWRYSAIPMRELCLVLAAGFVLSACSEKEVILPGERISITSPGSTLLLEPDASAASEGALAGEAQQNSRFETPGFSDNHAGGHFLVDLPLSVAYHIDVGIDADIGTELAQPVAGDGKIFTIMPLGDLRATSVSDGKPVWQLDIDLSTDKTQASISGGLGLEGNVLFAHAGKERLFALNAATGEEIWSMEFDDFLVGGPTISAGVVIVTDVSGKVIAVSAEDGQQIWNRIGSRGDTRVTGSSFPAVMENEVIIGGAEGELTSLSLDQGQVNWGEHLSPPSLLTALDTFSDITAHPVHDGGLVVVITQSGLMVAFNARSGRVVWEHELRGITMPWLAGQTIYLTTVNGHLYALRRVDGALRWKAYLPGSFDILEPISEDAHTYASPIVVSGKVLVPGTTGQLHVFDAETGEAEQTLPMRGPVTTAPIVVDGTVFTLNRDGGLSAFR
jgi:outer membrane protein assembly factor BamB